MNLPHHTVLVPALTCADCWQVHGVRGAVAAVVTADGTVLYHRCACGSDAIDPAPAQQLDLFGRTAA